MDVLLTTKQNGKVFDTTAPTSVFVYWGQTRNFKLGEKKSKHYFEEMFYSKPRHICLFLFSRVLFCIDLNFEICFGAKLFKFLQIMLNKAS